MPSLCASPSQRHACAASTTSVLAPCASHSLTLHCTKQLNNDGIVDRNEMEEAQSARIQLKWR